MSAGTAAELAAEASRLRRLIEKQPICVLRVGLDSLLLAVNDVAISVLGAHALGDVLGRQLIEYLAAEHRPGWAEFAARVRTNGSASFECDLVPMSGDGRTVLLQGAALLDHPDGVDSIVLGIRDVTALRRLERALEQEDTNRRNLEETRTKLEQVLAERQALETELGETRAGAQRVAATAAERDSERGLLDLSHKAELERLQQLVEQQQLALMEKEREQRELVNDLRAELAQVVGEQTRLTMALEERGAERQQLEADWTATRADLERALHEERRNVSHSKERSHQKLIDLESRLSASVMEQARLAGLLDQQRRLDAERVGEHARLERAIAEAREQADHGRSDRETAAALEAQLAAAAADRAHLIALLDDHDAERQRLEIEHAGVRQELERVLAEATEREARKDAREQQERADLEVQLSRALAAEARLSALLAARDTERQRLEADHVAECARLELLIGEESGRAAELHERARRELEAGLTAATAEGDRLAREVDRMAREHEQGQKRVEKELATSEANRERLVAEYSADRAQAERALGDAIIKKNQILKALADQRVELQQLSENARALEPLAAAGRLAVDVGRDLEALAAEIDARTRFLLSVCPVDAAYRQELETLRAEALRVRSLANQFALTNLRQLTIPYEHDQDELVPALKPKESAERP